MTVWSKNPHILLKLKLSGFRRLSDSDESIGVLGTMLILVELVLVWKNYENTNLAIYFNLIISPFQALVCQILKHTSHLCVTELLL